MKRLLVFIIVSALVCFSAFASFEGRTSVGINYAYNDGNMTGISVDNVGYINGDVGYYIGVDTDFDVNDIDVFRIGMIAGPSYQYHFYDVNMSVEISGGLSADYKNKDLFRFGIGGYIGAVWHFAPKMNIILGTKLGSDFVSVDLSDNNWDISGDFFVIPMLSIGFKY